MSGYAGFRITELWCFSQVDPDDDEEGIIGIQLDGRDMLPLVASDKVRADEYRAIAQQWANKSGRRVLERHFTLDGGRVVAYDPEEPDG
jgi:hypothetical protein